MTGQIDWAVLDQLTDLWLTAHGHAPGPSNPGPSPSPGNPSTGTARTGSGGPSTGPAHPGTCGLDPAVCSAQLDASAAATRERLQASLLHWSIDLLSGPGGLASYLRTGLLGVPFTSLSQPLDLGRSTRTVPPHLRAAVIARDQHCQFPGCRQPPSVCEVHHLIPWAKGGPTSLGNLGLYCRFHHLIVIHRWGWQITRHPDGTTTATAPDGRILHSHSPPQHAA